MFDTKINQFISVDTGTITFGASFNIFGTEISNPQNGFCDIITIRGVNTNRELGSWGTTGYLDQFGCNELSYRCRMGFKPLVKGTYSLQLLQQRLFGSCANKKKAYNAFTNYRFKSSDLGLEIFNGLTKNEKGGRDGINFYTSKINNKEAFVFKVE